MGKKIIGLFSLFFILFVLNIEVTASAAPKLQVDVSAGIDGKTKYDRGGPISITVENTGTSFSGDLVIDVMDSYNQGAGRAIPIDIESGETKTITITVDNVSGATDMYGGMNAKTIHFFDGGWKTGKEIAHKGAQFITTTTFDENETFAMTMTKNIDRLSSIRSAGLNQGSSIQIADISKIGTAQFPDDAVGLDAIDYLIVDEYPLADLKKEKQEAILEWIKRGGVIIVGGSTNVSAEVGTLSEYLPLQLNELIEVSPKALNDWMKRDELEEKIPVFSAVLNEGGIALVEDGEHVLVASQKIGKGQILQTAFSVGNEPLSDTSSMPLLWQTMFEAGNAGMHLNANSYIHHQIQYPLLETNELFSSFKVSVPIVFAVIIIYIILIVPILYFVLKSKDRREYAWWVIPAIALITSIAIFGYGAKDRLGRSQIQHTAWLNINENENAEGYFVESILANKKGNYTFSTPKGTTLFASLSDNPFGTNANLIHKRAIIEDGASGTSLHFRNIGYWNVASMYGKSQVENIGQYSIQLTNEKEKLQGTITNDFPFAINDVSIWSGNKLIPIGDLGPGETITINETLNLPVLAPPRPLNYQTFNNTKKDDIYSLRKDSIVAFTADVGSTVGKPLLIGFTDTEVIPVTLEEKKVSTSALTMISQPITVQNKFEGHVDLNDELMDLVIHMKDIGYGSHQDIVRFPTEEYYFEGMEYTAIRTLPMGLQKDKADWEQLKITNNHLQLYESSLFNVQANKYEPLDEKEITITENLKDYISNDGEIIVKFIFKDGQDGNYNRLPKIELSGEVSK